MVKKYDVNISNFNDELFPEYENWLRTRGDHPYSEHTIRAYLRVNVDFYKFLNEIGKKSYHDVKIDTVMLYIQKLSKNGLKSSTIKNMVSCADSFFEWLFLDENIDSNPFEVYKRKNKRKGRSGGDIRIKTVFYENEIEVIYDFLAAKGGRKSLRDLALFCFLLDTGVRADELARVTLYDLEVLVNSGRLRVTGKGNKERKVRTNGIYHKELQSYLIKLKSEQCKSDVLAFLSNKNHHYTQSALFKKVQQWVERSGLQKPKVGVHTLRHTAASIYYKEHQDILKVQGFLGHSSLETTQRYVHSLGEL